MYKIGITVREVIVDDTKKEFVNTSYMEFLNNCREIIPIIISASTENISQILSFCDGFLITGGDDLDPVLYNEENTSSNITPKSIDDLDKAVINYCLKSKKPLLGICRGLQSLNVFLGGSLHQNIENHRDNNHEILLYDNSMFTKLASNRLIVNSFHHQAINKLADRLNCVGVASDGIIEVVEHKELPMFAVQYHPEKMIDTNGLLVLNYFLALVKQYKA